MEFTEDELAFIASAMRTAADVYKHDAVTMHTEGQSRLADQFSDQKRRASKLADKIAEAVGV